MAGCVCDPRDGSLYLLLPVDLVSLFSSAEVLNIGSQTPDIKVLDLHFTSYYPRRCPT